jgi:hypothetical protein
MASVVASPSQPGGSTNVTSIASDVPNVASAIGPLLLLLLLGERQQDVIITSQTDGHERF